MSFTFKDHFSENSGAYKAHRPTYPPELFEFLASVSPSKQMAWDCGTGNGQAADALALYFERVVATDASEAQLNMAAAHDRVEYIVAHAEQAPLEAGSVDLVTVAQALHWFDIEAFFIEAHRVLKSGGILAVWTYNLARIEPTIDRILDEFAYETVGSHWPPERTLVDEDYRAIGFPFSKVETPAFDMTLTWRVSDLLAYMTTWSAVSRFRETEGYNPVRDVEEKIRSLWKDESRRVRWPLSVFVRRK